MNSDPHPTEEIVAQLQNKAERIETRTDTSVVVWHKWPSANSNRAPIVLFHGGFGSWTHWFKVIEGISAWAPVIAADLPGLGDSSDVDLPHTPDQLADILVQGLIQIFGNDQPFHLVGFSFGGMLGSLVAKSFGDQCLTFTAVGASGFGDLHYIVDGIKMPSESLTQVENDEINRNNLQRLMFADKNSVDPLSLYIHQTNVMRGRIRSRRMSVSDRLLLALPDIKARIGGIWGELDATGGGLDAIQKRAEIFRGHQPGAPFDMIEGAGHWVMYEKPDAFTATLLKQLDTSY